MNRKTWSDLQSRRAIIHRRKRAMHKLTQARKAHLKEVQGPLRPLEMPRPVEAPIHASEGIFRRITRRIVGT